MAKRLQISDDSGVTWFTFPGSKADFQSDAGAIKDTILGQNYESTQSGLIGWTMSTDGLFKGFAGYVAKVMKSGASTATVDEAMAVVSGKTYQITAATKRILDRTVAYTVKDNAVAVAAADIDSIDYLFGKVTFAAGYTPTGPITISANYLPMTQVASYQSFTLTQTTNAIDDSTMDVVQTNGGYRTFESGLSTVSLSLKGVYKASNGFKDLLQSRAELVIEINPDGNSKSVARGWFKPMSTGQSGDVGALEEEDLTFNLSVPAQDDIDLPFGWNHASDTTLNTAIKKALTAWEDATQVDVNYLPDGATGKQGTAIVTDVTLTSGIDNMNDFAIKLQGVGAFEAYP